MRFVSASSDRTVKLWDRATAGLIATFTVDGTIEDLSITPDARMIVAVDALGCGHLPRQRLGSRALKAFLRFIHSLAGGGSRSLLLGRGTQCREVFERHSCLVVDVLDPRGSSAL